MKTANFSELRHRAKDYFDSVEEGETIEVFRHGKPIARIVPYEPQEGKSDRWKTVKPLRLKGVSLSKAILADRRENRS